MKIKDQTPLIIINSHPIQYFAPLYKCINKEPAFNLIVYYCSKHGLNGELDNDFGKSIKWDIPLLEGYRYKFLRNASYKPSIYSFWGLINLDIIKILWKAQKSVVVIHGWAYATNIIAIIFGKLFGHIVCLRGESPLKHEYSRNKIIRSIRKFIFKYILFPWINYFLYIGEQNRKFYEYLGVLKEKLIFTPYSVNNSLFIEKYKIKKNIKIEKREELNISPDAKVLLFSGKYIYKKRPLNLLKAFHRVKNKNLYLVLMGDGYLRSEMESYIDKNNITNVLLTGFINQNKISDYYLIADIYVMCSGVGETWGLSTNEAMNFHLPILLSDMVGCSDDLLEEGKNGYIHKCDNIEELAETIKKVVSLPNETLELMGQNSAFKVQQYSYDRIVESLKEAFLKTHYI